MRRIDLILLTIIIGITLAIRVWAPWGFVFGATRVNFLETDAWYHVRLLENEVRNFPHHVTADPYASLDAQYVAVAPLLDNIVATAVVVTRGTHASTAYIERVAALAPPIMGVFAVLAVWALATFAFGRREGLLAAFLASVLPGHFLDRTLLGFVDHHALETWLMFSAIAALVASVTAKPAVAAKLAVAAKPAPAAEKPSAVGPTGFKFPEPGYREILAGVSLGLYLLGWTSGSLLVAIIGAWLITLPFFAKLADIKKAALATATMAGVALAMVGLFQDPLLYRYSMQVWSLAGLLALGSTMVVLAPRVSLPTIRASIVGAAILMAITVAVAAPVFTSNVLQDFMRLSPDPARMSVLEARPLFLYSGNWNWNQPWEFFRSGFYLGAVALVLLTLSIWRSRRIDHWLIVIVTASMFAATVGQNRFGYYLVPACCVVIAWLSVRVLDWGGVPHAENRTPKIRAILPLQREIAVILVAGLAVAPNLVPAAITTSRNGGMPDYWASVMDWLRTQTPSPFSSDDYYLARYNPADLEIPSYTVMNWWDQGYWIVQTGHRVPLANPTQAKATTVAQFYTATNEARAIEILNNQRARYVIADWELPFRDIGGGALGGRFENLVTWAGRPTADFYKVCFARTATGFQHVWLYREAYYQTMAYRLSVLGGAGANPANSTWVVRTDGRLDANGQKFCEVSERQVYKSADEAKAAAQQKGPNYEVVGLTPWEPAFPIAPITGLRRAKDFRQPGQPLDQAPMARVFERIVQ